MNRPNSKRVLFFERFISVLFVEEGDYNLLPQKSRNRKIGSELTNFFQVQKQLKDSTNSGTNRNFEKQQELDIIYKIMEERMPYKYNFLLTKD